MDSYREIENLIYEAAWLTDTRGPRYVCENIFTHCMVLNPDTGESQLGPEMADFAESMLKTWGPDRSRRSLKTAHRVSNVWIEVDEAADTAIARSYLSMLQAVPESGFPLQPIGCGVYHDTFVRVDGRWRFDTHGLEVTLLGDMSRHAAAFDELPLWQLAIHKLTVQFPFLQRFMPTQ